MTDLPAIRVALHDLRRPIFVVKKDGDVKKLVARIKAAAAKVNAELGVLSG